MKKIFALLFTLLVLSTSVAQATDLYTNNVYASGTVSITTGITQNGHIVFNTTGSTGSSNLENVAIGQSSLPVTTGSYNTSVGYESLKANTTGFDNVAVGQRAMLDNTTGRDNTALGTNALWGATTEVGNTAVGSGGVLFNITSGDYNTGVGYGAIQWATTPVEDTAVGTNALGGQNLSNPFTGSADVAMGMNAAQMITSANDIVAIGFGALNAVTSGGFNTAVGHSALLVETTGTNNVAIGHDALMTTTTSSNNVAVGEKALRLSNTAVGASTAVGFESQQAVTTGYANASLGFETLLNLTTGIGNTAVGQSAGSSYATSTSSVFIGDNSQASADGNSNEIVIGYNSVGHGTNTITLGNTSLTDLYTTANVHAAAATFTGKILGAEGSTTTTGFAFTEAGNDTGMFSPSDGTLDLYANATKIWDGQSTLITTYVPVTVNGNLTSTGTVSAPTATFSTSVTGGAISGTTGTFTGGVSGTTGTFSNAVTSPTITKVYQGGTQLTASPHREWWTGTTTVGTTTVTFAHAFTSAPYCVVSVGGGVATDTIALGSITTGAAQLSDGATDVYYLMCEGQ